MDDILKEAIADAKALRATALENAKIALEEAFTPRLKSMLSQKIQSEVEDSDTEGEVGSGDGHMAAEDEHEVEERMHGEDEDELEERMKDEDEEEVKEGEHMEDETEDEDEVKEGEHMEDEEMEDDSEVSEDEHMEDEGEHMEDEEDELDLESVIRELEEELDSSDIGDAENKEPSERATDSSEVGAQGPEGEGADEEGGKENSEDEVVKEPVTEADEMEDEDDDIDLEEVIKALSEEEGMEDEEEEDKMDEMQTTLKEYKETIGYLREKLNEVNLMNAKLLFTNKLFRGFGLNNNQKLQVVEQFDRTQNLREIKLVYTTLAESFKGNGNKRVNESKGQASKAVASTEPKKEVLSEGMEMKNRFKKLANLI
jgi:hypothetical protein